MQNKLLFIESNTTGSGMIALKKAASCGLTPIFFTNDPERYLGLDEKYCQVYVCNTNEFVELKKTIEKNFSREDICGITTTSEFYLETVAKLSTLYGLPGNPPDVMRRVRNKALTRQTLVEAGVHQPEFIIVRDVSEIEGAIKKIGLPCVLKPADDSGSNDVLLCNSLAHAEQHASKILARTVNIRGQKTVGIVLVEQYVQAPEFSVEMFTWQGETTCIGITQKSLTGFPYFVESRHLFPAPLTVDLATEIQETVRSALSAVGIKNGATHTEVKWTQNGCAIIEINARLAGGMIPELIRLATGIDMLDQQMRCAVDGPRSLNVKTSGVAGIQFLMAEEKGTLLHINGTEDAARVPGVELVKITAKPDTIVHPPQNAYHRLGFVIVHTDIADKTVDRLEKAISHLKLHFEEKGGILNDRITK